MPEMSRNRSVGAETMKITVVGALAVVAVILAAVLLIQHLNRKDNQGSEQSPS